MHVYLHNYEKKLLRNKHFIFETDFTKWNWYWSEKIRVWNQTKQLCNFEVALQRELQNYIEFDVTNLTRTEDSRYKANLFYQLYETHFPTLSKIAVIVLCVTATSVPAEALFSISGIIQNEQRNRIQPSALNMITIIKNN